MLVPIKFLQLERQRQHWMEVGPVFAKDAIQIHVLAMVSALHKVWLRHVNVVVDILETIVLSLLAVVMEKVATEKVCVFLNRTVTNVSVFPASPALIALKSPHALETRVQEMEIVLPVQMHVYATLGFLAQSVMDTVHSRMVLSVMDMELAPMGPKVRDFVLARVGIFKRIVPFPQILVLPTSALAMEHVRLAARMQLLVALVLTVIVERRVRQHQTLVTEEIAMKVTAFCNLQIQDTNATVLPVGVVPLVLNVPVATLVLRVFPRVQEERQTHAVDVAPALMENPGLAPVLVNREVQETIVKHKIHVMTWVQVHVTIRRVVDVDGASQAITIVRVAWEELHPAIRVMTNMHPTIPLPAVGIHIVVMDVYSEHQKNIVVMDVY